MGDSAQGLLWLVIAAFVVTIPLVSLARRAGVSYAIVLVLGGLVIGFLPFVPRVDLEPDLVLVVFLPPLLYWEAITAPTDVMRANARWIASLAIGLVIVTTLIVALVAHAAIPGSRGRWRSCSARSSRRPTSSLRRPCSSACACRAT